MYVHFKGDKNLIVFKKSYDKRYLTLMVISYEIIKLAKGLFIKFHNYEMTTCVRSSIYIIIFIINFVLCFKGVVFCGTNIYDLT